MNEIIESNELAIVQKLTPLDIFADKEKADQIIAKMEELVNQFEGDITTPQGQTAIRSFDRKIANSKTFIDKMGKQLTEEWREKTANVNAERKRLWVKMEELQQKVTEPLDLWQAKEKARKDAIKARIERFAVLSSIVGDSESLRAAIKDVLAAKNDGWDEFEYMAAQEREKALNALQERLDQTTKMEKERAELEMLRKVEADRLQAERETQIAAEAANAARIEAEQRAEKEKQALIDAANEAQRKAEADQIAAIKAAQDAEKNRLKAIADAEEKQRWAVIAERDKIAAEQKAIADAEAKRAADTQHKKKVNNAAADALFNEVDLIDRVMAQGIIILIAQGKIPHVKINY